MTGRGTCSLRLVCSKVAVWTPAAACSSTEKEQTIHFPECERRKSKLKPNLLHPIFFFNIHLRTTGARRTRKGVLLARPGIRRVFKARARAPISEKTRALQLSVNARHSR